MRKDVIKAFTALITAAFGLVAALAWNGAIQEIFKIIFGEQSGVYALITYAVIVTIIATIVTLGIGRAAAKAGVVEKKPADQEVEALRSELQSVKEELRRMKETEAA